MADAERTDDNKMLFAHGMENRYGGVPKKELEQAAEKIAKAHGYSGIHAISSDSNKKIIKALQDKKITGVLGFSRGGNRLRTLLQDPKTSPEIKSRIKEAMLVGSPETKGDVPGSRTTDIPYLKGVEHMKMIQDIATREPTSQGFKLLQSRLQKRKPEHDTKPEQKTAVKPTAYENKSRPELTPQTKADAGRVNMTPEKYETQKKLYEGIVSSGVRDTQARQLTAEFGREADYDKKAMFGIHWDSNRWNLGPMSWTTDRAQKLIPRLEQEKIISKDTAADLQKKFARVGAEPPTGKGEHRQQVMKDEGAALKTQMGFVREEMDKTGGAGDPRHTREWLHGPDMPDKKAAEVLGKKYFGWDYAGRHIGQKHADEAREKVQSYRRLLDEKQSYDPSFHRHYGAAGIKNLIDRQEPHQPPPVHHPEAPKRQPIKETAPKSNPGTSKRASTRFNPATNKRPQSSHPATAYE